MVTLFLPGNPARVTHQSGTRYGKGHTHKSASLRKWEATLANELRQYVPDQPIEGPVALAVCFGFEAKTKSKINTWKVTRPDTDNQIKTLKDVMTKLGFWKDDSQVALERCSKIWTDEPGILIQYEELPMEIESETNERK